MMSKIIKNLGININMASAQNLYSSVAGENATPAYAVADLNYGRKLMVGKKELNFLAGVNNIFDKNYHDHMDWNDVPRPGRNIFIKFSVQF